MSKTPTETQARLAEIRARVEAATPGPWKVGKQWRHSGAPSSGTPTIPIDCQYPGEAKGEGLIAWLFGSALPRQYFRANAKFIAHARDDIPFLLDLIAALKPFTTEEGK